MFFKDRAGNLGYDNTSGLDNATTPIGPDPGDNSSVVLGVSVDNLTASGEMHQNRISWDNVTGATSYTLYWSLTSPVDNTSNRIEGITGTLYIHGGLDNGTTYYYNLIPQSTSWTGLFTDEVSATPTGWSCTSSADADNDTDLLAYYPFNNNLQDNVSAGTPRSPYHLTNQDGTIRFAQGCASGLAAYFDSSTGFAENNDFYRIDAVDDDNYTVMFWVSPDEDIASGAAAFSSKDAVGLNFQDSFQIDVTEVSGSDYLRWTSTSNSAVSVLDNTSVTPQSWYHLAAVHLDND
ncbi:MAG: LamG-like jellyroll fold domain-containing protein, partial [Burkholderiaceae bacterium]